MSRVSDEELTEYLSDTLPEGIDGIWHPATQALVELHGATGIVLNRWWFLTPTDWVCPGCERGKPAIAWLNKHGALNCQLVEHHDHMDQYLRSVLERHAAESDWFNATRESEKFVWRCANAIAAFDPVIICEDCNNIDSTAKKLVGAPPEFSFTASDIKQFAIPHSNTSHEIARAALDEIWNFRKAQLAQRSVLAEELATLAAQNRQWYEGAPTDAQPEGIERRAKGNRFLIKIQGRAIDFSQVEFVSTAKATLPANTRKWRKNKVLRAPRAPTSSEINYVASVTHKKHFEVVSEDWACPWCGRPKLMILRPSKQFSWSFEINTIRENVINRTQKTVICGDCNKVRIRLAKEAGVENGAIQQKDVSSVIIARSHSEHGLKGDGVIDEVVEQIGSRVRDTSDQ